jgi:hypothetical protein
MKKFFKVFIAATIVYVTIKSLRKSAKKYFDEQLSR